MRILLAAILLLIAEFSYGQKSHFGSWNVINTRITLAHRWEAFNEMQLRSQSYYADHFYHEIKTGISYYVNKNFSVLMGVGKYHTYSDPGSFTKPVTANETRLWQQLTMNNYLGNVKFEHRYRIEQRWFKTGYRNRFRYRLGASVPVDKSAAGKPYISAFNEVFLTNTEPHYERNRFFVGFGYKINSWVTLQPGYVYQYDFRDDEGNGKHFFQLTLNIDLDGDRNPWDKASEEVD